MEYLPRIHHIAALQQSPRVTVKIERNTRKISLDGLSSCRCSTTSHGDLKTIKKNASQVLNSFLSMRRDLEQDNGHSSDLDQKRSGTLVSEDSPQGEWDRIAEQMMFTLAESKQVFRSTSPLSRGVLKSKGGRKIVNTLLR